MLMGIELQVQWKKKLFLLLGSCSLGVLQERFFGVNLLALTSLLDGPKEKIRLLMAPSSYVNRKCCR